MVSRFHRRWTFSCAVLLAVTLTGPLVRGQGFLDQLEQKAREGLGGLTESANKPSTQDKPATAGAELPPPTARRTPPPPPAPAASNAARSGPTSILEQNSTTQNSTARRSAVPMPVPSPVEQSNDPSPLGGEEGGVYLGLEAESLTGGGIGARVVNVTDSSPAWRAGFKPNDVILAIDGFAISNLDTMVDRLTLRRPGDTIKVLLLRGTRNLELTAVLQNAALAQRLHGVNPNSRTPSPLTPAGHAWLGVVVADLSSAFRTQFGLRAFRAAAVTNVTKGSPADALSIQPGDAIVGADGRPIETARELLDWMATKRPGDFVTLNVMRGARASLLETTLVTDPKFQPAAAARPAPEPFSNALPVDGPLTGSSLNIEASDNTVPAPFVVDPAAESTEVQQLRGELKSAQSQIQLLEQRLAELETLLKKK